MVELTFLQASPWFEILIGLAVFGLFNVGMLIGRIVFGPLKKKRERILFEKLYEEIDKGHEGLQVANQTLRTISDVLNQVNDAKG